MRFQFKTLNERAVAELHEQLSQARSDVLETLAVATDNVQFYQGQAALLAALIKDLKASSDKGPRQ